MLSPQLRKLKIQLEEGREQIDIDKEQLLKELNELDEIKGILLESLALSKSNKTDSEVQLLAELQSLSGIIDSRLEHSLSLSTKVCKACGRPL